MHIYTYRWKPDLVSEGVPIPLFYQDIKFPQRNNILNLKRDKIVYQGFRAKDSLELHDAFGNKDGGYEFKFGRCLQAIFQDVKKLYSLSPMFLGQDDQRPTYGREFIGMNPRITDHNLIFNSQFESGNLDIAMRLSDYEYDLYMRPDTNRTGKHQWFYFTVKNKTKCRIKFNILNFSKRSSLYQQGMKVSVFSEMATRRAKKGLEEEERLGWHKTGDLISYGMSKLTREMIEDSQVKKYYYSVSFEYYFDYENDTVSFAYCFPYTFSKLTTFLKKITTGQKELGENRFVKEGSICKSLSGIDVPMLTITNRVFCRDWETIPEDNINISNMNVDNGTDKSDGTCSEESESQRQERKKEYVIVTARVHPGETPGSWMMEGFIKWLCSPHAHQLRNRLIFKVIPMTNPDGVIVGNYRSSLSGNDLNRKFLDPIVKLHPTVSAIKKICNKIIEDDGEILAFLDMHGHSKKKGVFIYGPYYPPHSQRYLRIRMFPKLVGNKTEMFRYLSCKFTNERSRRKAARLVLCREYGIKNSYTIEASFHGYLTPNRKTIEFGPKEYKEMGKNIASTLMDYLLVVDNEEYNKLENQRNLIKKRKKGIIDIINSDASEMKIESHTNTNTTSYKKKQQGTTKNQSKSRRTNIERVNHPNNIESYYVVKEEENECELESSIISPLKIPKMSGNKETSNHINLASIAPKHNLPTFEELIKDINKQEGMIDLDGGEGSGSDSEAPEEENSDNEFEDLRNGIVNVIEGYRKFVKKKGFMGATTFGKKKKKKNKKKKENSTENLMAQLMGEKGNIEEKDGTGTTGTTQPINTFGYLRKRKYILYIYIYIGTVI